MDEQISKGTNLGVVLIALAAIIAVGFGVFALARGTANEGVTQVQETLNNVSMAQFADYDQKIVTGSQVMSAVKNFKGKPYAILISTQALKDIVGYGGGSSGSVTVGAGAGLDKAYGDGKVPYVIAFKTGSVYDVKSSDDDEPSNNNGDFLDTTQSNGDEVPLVFINYNALLSNAPGNSISGTTISKAIGFDNNCWRNIDGFNVVDGRVQFNGITTNLNKSGMTEYISSGSRFQSYLIKDRSGTIMGIAFEQVSSK